MIAVATAFVAFGCADTSVLDDFSTEVTVVSPGAVGNTLEVRKRFRFSRGPEETQGITPDRVSLQVLSPQGVDLSFIHRLRVYADVPGTGDGADVEPDRVALATAEGIEPGESYVLMDIIFDGDVRELVTSDRRITLTFAIEPSSWFRPFPEEGIVVLVTTTMELAL